MKRIAVTAFSRSVAHAVAEVPRKLGFLRDDLFPHTIRLEAWK